MLRKFIIIGALLSSVSIAQAQELEARSSITFDSFKGADSAVSIGALTAEDLQGNYGGTMFPTRPKAIVTRPNTRLTCINTSPYPFDTAFFLDVTGKRATMYFFGGAVVKGRLKGRSFTGSAKINGRTYRAALKGISPTQANATITAVQKVMPGAICEYPSKGTVYRF
ncbi:MAG: hypothetical protein QY326_02690 [Bdellovibrionota bacterium]|nr:MAG: hypothetical protein QY326_02690 [Bdellovibrionota bacterium]